jgi:hypothetical protein
MNVVEQVGADKGLFWAIIETERAKAEVRGTFSSLQKRYFTWISEEKVKRYLAELAEEGLLQYKIKYNARSNITVSIPKKAEGVRRRIAPSVMGGTL